MFFGQNFFPDQKFFSPLIVVGGWWLGWVEKLKISKIDYGHEVPIVIHKNEAISLFTF